MFDIGFSELLLFGVIALIVLGPEKLPQAARTAGQWYAKIRRTVSTLQSEIEAELDLAETRQLMQKELAKIRQTEADMRREMAEIRGNMKEFEHSQSQNLKPSQTASNSDQRSESDIIKNDTVKSDLIKNDKAHSEQGSNQPTLPKEFDYAYEQDEKQRSHEPVSTPGIEQNTDDHLTNASSDDTIQTIQTFITRPWANMWFRLGAYDKARRLPMPPYLPNYKADVLLNSHSNNSLDSSLKKQLAVNEQVADS